MNLRTSSLLALALVACGNKQSGTKPEPGAPSVTGQPAAAVEPEEPNRILVTAADGALAAWLAAQNAGDFASYIALYDASFAGVRRTPDGGAKELDLAGWKADREKMFRGKLEVAIDHEEFAWDGQAGEFTFTFSFTQRFRAGKYADHGRKLITITGDGLIVREEMVWSKPGWEDAAGDPAPTTSATATTSFAELVNSASVAAGDRIDATALGTAVEAYVVTRYGAPGTQDVDMDQQLDRWIVLMGNGMAMRVEVGSAHDTVIGTQEPFGTMKTAAPMGKRKFDAENDAFYGAPTWRNKARVLLADTSESHGDQHTIALTHEADALVVWSAELWWEEGASDKWTKDRTFKLAKGATVTTPTRTIPAPVMTDPVRVHVIEEKSSSKTANGYSLALQLGDRVGPVAYAQTTPDDKATWVVHASGITGTALAAKSADLPAPLPKADAFFGHRLYRFDDRLDSMLLGRVGDELVMWVRVEDSSAQGEWFERLRVAVPAGAKLDVR